jgi:hypothetical protein
VQHLTRNARPIDSTHLESVKESSRTADSSTAKRNTIPHIHVFAEFKICIVLVVESEGTRRIVVHVSIVCFLSSGPFLLCLHPTDPFDNRTRARGTHTQHTRGGSRAAAH